MTVTDNKGDTASDEVTVNVNVVTSVGNDPALIIAQVIVAPNPTTSHFSLKLRSTSNKAVSLYVTDAAGRVIEQRSNLQPNTVFMLGQQYVPGAYYAQVIQAGRVFVVQLLKLP